MVLTDILNNSHLELPPGSPSIPGIPNWGVVQTVSMTGRDLQWMAFIVFVIATAIMGVMACRHEKRNRAFHLILILVTIIASLSYYAMATRTGFKYLHLGSRPYHRNSIELYRQIYWARHVDWALTTPLLLLCLSLLGGIPYINIIGLLVADEAMVLTGLFAALTPGRKITKWGWFIFSCIFLAYVFHEILYNGYKTSKNRHPSVSKLYAQLSIYTAILWVMYPLFFALCQVSGIISVDWEVGIFAVLDVLSKVGFGLWLLLSHKPTSEGEFAGRIPDYLVEERGTTTGPIQLPGEGE